MTTVINTPSGGNGDSGAGIILGVIVAIVIIILFFVYGLPAIRDADRSAEPAPSTNINVEVPMPTGGTNSETQGGASTAPGAAQ